jgi:hypothetical protein
VKKRTPVILQHHPIHNPASRTKTALEGLWDAAAEIELLAEVEHAMVLHGHLHRRMHRTLATRRGKVDAVGATSASLLHEDPHRMAGFNLYTFADGGALEGIEARRFDPELGTFVDTHVPRH